MRKNWKNRNVKDQEYEQESNVKLKDTKPMKERILCLIVC